MDPAPAPATVTRSIELPAPVEEVWTSIGSADGLAAWLGDSVELAEVVPGAAGVVREGGTVRRLVVTEVSEARSIGFVWWDEAAPAEASVVTVTLAPGGDGTTVTVSERLAGASHASLEQASTQDLFAAEASWDRRLQALVGACAPADALV